MARRFSSLNRVQQRYALSSEEKPVLLLQIMSKSTDKLGCAPRSGIDPLNDRPESRVFQPKVCDDLDVTLVEFNGEPSHVHLLIHYPPTLALSTLVNSLKGVSARLLRKEFTHHIQQYLWGTHFWSPSYFVGSCGGAPLQIVKDYIENQKRPPPPDPRSSRP